MIPLNFNTGNPPPVMPAGTMTPQRHASLIIVRDLAGDFLMGRESNSAIPGNHDAFQGLWQRGVGGALGRFKTIRELFTRISQLNYVVPGAPVPLPLPFPGPVAGGNWTSNMPANNWMVLAPDLDVDLPCHPNIWTWVNQNNINVQLVGGGVPVPMSFINIIEPWFRQPAFNWRLLPKNDPRTNGNGTNLPPGGDPFNDLLRVRKMRDDANNLGFIKGGRYSARGELADYTRCIGRGAILNPAGNNYHLVDPATQLPLPLQEPNEIRVPLGQTNVYPAGHNPYDNLPNAAGVVNDRIYWIGDTEEHSVFFISASPALRANLIINYGPIQNSSEIYQLDFYTINAFNYGQMIGNSRTAYDLLYYFYSGANIPAPDLTNRNIPGARPLPVAPPGPAVIPVANWTIPPPGPPGPGLVINLGHSPPIRVDEDPFYTAIREFYEETGTILTNFWPPASKVPLPIAGVAAGGGGGAVAAAPARYVPPSLRGAAAGGAGGGAVGGAGGGTGAGAGRFAALAGRSGSSGFGGAGGAGGAGAGRFAALAGSAAAGSAAVGGAGAGRFAALAGSAGGSSAAAGGAAAGGGAGRFAALAGSAAAGSAGGSSAAGGGGRGGIRDFSGLKDQRGGSDSDSIWKNKYLKYKTKYLELKNLIE